MARIIVRKSGVAASAPAAGTAIASCESPTPRLAQKAPVVRIAGARRARRALMRGVYRNVAPPTARRPHLGELVCADLRRCCLGTRQRAAQPDVARPSAAPPARPALLRAW